jgi:TetR/AcrR family transcriptional regulator, transcriptional repressor for nem operon
MRYPPTHSDDTRRKIVQSARKLFNRSGFDKISIQQIMADASLTRGGFYRHFKSKSDLYAEVLSCFFTDPKWGNNWGGVSIDLNAADAGPQIIRAYLSRQHAENIDDSCPMVALPSDVARAGASARRAFETVFRAMVDMLQRDAQGNRSQSRRAALAIAALCVGGMVIARASNDRMLADELRDAATDVALKLGGWDRGGARKRTMSAPRRLASGSAPTA